MTENYDFETPVETPKKHSNNPEFNKWNNKFNMFQNTSDIVKSLIEESHKASTAVQLCKIEAFPALLAILKQLRLYPYIVSPPIAQEKMDQLIIKCEQINRIEIRKEMITGRKHLSDSAIQTITELQQIIMFALIESGFLFPIEKNKVINPYNAIIPT